MDRADFTAVTLGYVIMRLSMVVQWIGAAADHPLHRVVARRYAVGVVLVQVGGVLRLLLPAELGLASFALLAIGELTVPILAERGSTATWHREHIAERYGLFTLIVLGEAVLGSVNALQGAIAEHGVSGRILVLAFGGLILFFGCWWTYFDRPFAESLKPDPVSAFGWGYAHYFLFASLAGLGSGLEVALAYFEAHEHMSARTAGFAVTIPVSVFLVVLGSICAAMLRRPTVAVVAALQSVLILAVTWAIASVAVANRAGGARGLGPDATMAAL